MSSMPQPGVPIQTSPFEPVTFYDAPEVIFTQLWDGEFNAGLAAKTFISPNELTPSERDSVSQRLSKAAGDSSIVKAIAGVATNPWTWFLFLTSPIGEKPVGDLFQLAAKYSMYGAKHAPVLASTGLLTTQHALMSSRSGRAVSQFIRGQESVLRMPEYVAYNDELVKVLTANGLSQHGLQWEKYAQGSVEQLRAKEISFALNGALGGLDRQVTRSVPYKPKDSAVPALREVVDEPLVSQSLEGVLAKYGAQSLVPSARSVFKATADKVFPNEDAIIRLWSNMGRNLPESEWSPKDLAGRAMVQTVLGDMAEGINEGTVTAAQFKEAINKAVLTPIRKDQFYMPLNMSEVYAKGSAVKGSMNLEARWAAAMRAGGSVGPRMANPTIYHPDDLRTMGDLFGGTQHLQARLAQAEEIMKESVDSNRPVRMFRMNPTEGIGKYVDSMSRTYGMFVQDVGEGVLEVDRELVGKLTTWTTDTATGSHRSSLSGVGAPVTKTLSEVAGTELAPAGGISIADVLYGDYANATTQWHRNTLSKVVIPRLMGRVNLQSTVKMDALNTAKGWAESFVNTGAGKAIRESGEFGERFIKGLENYSQSVETSFQEGEALQKFLTKGLYAGALGYNMSSVMVNATQPFLFAGMWGGYDNVIKGYGEAFKELGDYLGKRAAQGFKPISTGERANLIRSTHKLANWDGEDLLEVAGDTLSNLEGKLYQSFTADHKVKGTLERVLFEYPMALFTSGEIINRNVAGHVALYRAQAQAARGVKVSAEGMKDGVRNFVRETQYGSHWLNMPQAFLPEGSSLGVPTGRLLSNPLVRMFLTFPARSFTSLVHVSPHLAGREGSDVFKGFMNDTLRGLAVSAIGYEVGKGLLEADLSKAGLAAAVTDAIPGLSQGRFDFREGPVPVPPVVDIPYQVAKALATDDMALMQKQLPRIIPGGVALSRVLGATPQVPGLGFLGQTRYADWESLTQDGRVPVYQNDGTLIGMEGGVGLVLKGLGVDMGGFKSEQDLMGYLVKQREEIVAARREYMQHAFSGDLDKADQSAREFEKRFKVPLTVTRTQWKSFMDGRNRPRIERQLDRIPQDAREEYIKLVSQSQPETLNVAPDQFVSEKTSRARDRYRVSQGKIDPEVLAYIKAELENNRVPSPTNSSESTDEMWGPFKRASFQVGLGN